MGGPAAVLRFLAAVVPSGWGDDRFAVICNGSYSPGYGTTCGYLPQAALWFAGCRDERVLNFAHEGHPWRIGENLSALVQGGRTARALVEDDGALDAKPGDVLYYSNGSPASEHVEHLWEINADGSWTVATAGRRNARGDQCATWDTRTHAGRMFAFMGGETRRLVGRLDLDRLAFAAAPSGLAVGEDNDASGGGGLLLLCGALALGAAAFAAGRG